MNGEQQRKPDAPAAPEPPVHQGASRGIAADERLKRVIRQHPQRDEPRVDSVEPDETPPP